MTQDYSTASELKLMEGFPPPPEQQVTLENGFWTAPYNRWAYQNMRRLMPTAPIRCTAEPIPLKIAHDTRVENLAVRRPDDSLASFASFLHETFTDSLVVVSGETIVHESYLNGMTARTPHQMMSCTKSLAGLFALLAIDEDRASEGDTIASLLPDAGLEPGVASATLGQVLDLPPFGPSFITRVCGFDLDNHGFRFGQARRARSPQIAQALGALAVA
ncbi:MAG: hypothetical protein ACU0FH_05315, partial [Heliomarina sp.]